MAPQTPPPTSPYQTGDLVRLNSGGPLMTVLESKMQEVTCVWFDHKDHSTTATFHWKMLFSESSQ